MGLASSGGPASSGDALAERLGGRLGVAEALELGLEAVVDLGLELGVPSRGVSKDEPLPSPEVE